VVLEEENQEERMKRLVGAVVLTLTLGTSTIALQQDSTGDIRPIPDPTTLTTAQLFREITNLSLQVQHDIAALRAIIETRLDGYDKAIALLQRFADKVPSEVDVKVNQLQSLHAEKFRSIEGQFTSSKVALDSALQSSEKSNAEKNALQALAISKAETSVAEQLKGINVAISGVERVLNDKVLAIKERLDRMEGQSSGVGQSWGVIVAVVGIVIAVTALIVRIQTRS
jgi:hypothetical protein